MINYKFQNGLRDEKISKARCGVKFEKQSRPLLAKHPGGGGGGYSHPLHIRVCAAQRGRDFEAPDLERDIHFRGVF